MNVDESLFSLPRSFSNTRAAISEFERPSAMSSSI